MIKIERGERKDMEKEYKQLFSEVIEENENTNLSRPCTIYGEEDHNAVEHEIEDEE
jgi:hypothetical protein